jgi:hypothetical protein
VFIIFPFGCLIIERKNNMFSLLKNIVKTTANVVGTVAGIAVAPIAIALDISETFVKQAIEAGCRTEEEIKEWVEENC